MSRKSCTAYVAILAVLFTLAAPAQAASQPSSTTLMVPSGTKIYIELSQKVISKKKRNAANSVVQAAVWRDVVIDGQVAIPRGTRVEATVALVKSAKPAGVAGRLKLTTRSMTLEDGRSVSLVGDYSGKGRNAIASTIMLALFIAWPLIFLHGRNVVLEEGAVFDARTGQDFEIESMGAAPAPREGEEQLTAEIRGTVENKFHRPPLAITVCGQNNPQLSIDRVNGMELPKPIRIKTKQGVAAGDCMNYELKAPRKLGKHLRRGINRFQVAFTGPERRVATEVLYDQEL